MRLSLKSAKPALLNAETAWKTPCQVAVAHVSSYSARNRSVSSTAIDGLDDDGDEEDAAQHPAHVTRPDGLGLRGGRESRCAGPCGARGTGR